MFNIIKLLNEFLSGNILQFPALVKIQDITKPFFIQSEMLNICKPKYKKVQVGKDQEKAQSERDSHSKNRGGKKPN